MEETAMKEYAGKKVRIVIFGGQFTYPGEVLDNGHVCVRTRATHAMKPPGGDLP